MKCTSHVTKYVNTEYLSFKNQNASVFSKKGFSYEEINEKGVCLIIENEHVYPLMYGGAGPGSML